MIREEHFRQMKKTAIYISTGRGPTTDEPALIKALDEGMIAAAGLDVLEKEPPGGNNPLLTMHNVILTPHVASATARFDPARRRRSSARGAPARRAPTRGPRGSVIRMQTSRRSTRAFRRWWSGRPGSSGSRPECASPRGRYGSATAATCCGATSPTTAL